MHLVPEHVEAYTEAHTTPPPELLQELADETRASLRSPQMLAGTVQGRFLEMLVHASGARRVLEIGTYSGYSALSMAAALPDGGRIDTCEIDREHADVAQRYFDRSPFGGRITLHVGPALETIDGLEGDFDLVFVDADKSNYANYYEAVLPRLTGRGLIAFDNTLWSGRVLKPGDDADEDTRALVTLNESLVRDARVICVQLPVRDGVTLVRRAR